MLKFNKILNLEKLYEDKFTNRGTKNLKRIETFGRPRESLNGENNATKHRNETQIRVVFKVVEMFLIGFVQNSHNNENISRQTQ